MKKKTDFRQIKSNKKEDKVKVVILSGFSDSQLHNLINNYKKNNLPKAIFATVTKTSKEFKIKDLLKELKKEHKFMNK
ncbi:MAG: DUF3783 domain-containing protein [Nanoarchaeota archaeon]